MHTWYTTYYNNFTYDVLKNFGPSFWLQVNFLLD